MEEDLLPSLPSAAGGIGMVQLQSLLEDHERMREHREKKTKEKMEKEAKKQADLVVGFIWGREGGDGAEGRIGGEEGRSRRIVVWEFRRWSSTPLSLLCLFVCLLTPLCPHLSRTLLRQCGTSRSRSRASSG